jgi:hypothetical protein
MKSNELTGVDNQRRKFLGTFATGVAAFGLSSIAAPFKGHAENNVTGGAGEEWFNKIQGKHRIVFDVPEPNGIFPFAWPRIFLVTNEATGTPGKDCSTVVILRHNAIPYALDNRLWAKYDFNAVFKVVDPRTSKPTTKNPFWEPKPGEFKVPGVGPVPIGINELQASGVMFGVCNMALTVYSAVKKDPEEVRKDWVSGILPDIEVLPSGVWAINRAQEKGCSYCFAG